MVVAGVVWASERAAKGRGMEWMPPGDAHAFVSYWSASRAPLESRCPTPRPQPQIPNSRTTKISNQHQQHPQQLKKTTKISIKKRALRNQEVGGLLILKEKVRFE